MSRELEGKVAVITGAGRGIGRAATKALAEAGAAVVVASRTAATVEAVTAEVTAKGGKAHGVTCDLSSRQSVDHMVEEAVDAFGTVDILVNCAQSYGISGELTPTYQALETFPDDLWDHTFDSGVKATLHCMQAAFPHLRTRGGKVINFGSGNGILAIEGTVAYNANKEAIRALSRTAAREWGQYGINVNVVVPMIETESFASFMDNHPGMREQLVATNPLRRIGNPDVDAAPVIVFLASEGSDYLTGMTFMLDGGMVNFH
jgi:2-hydroxycyclohexanecarboxyl-CoA dehydrogenase